MDGADKSAAKDSWAEKIEVTQKEDERKQPWKDAIASEMGKKGTGESADSKSPDPVDDGSMEIIMTSAG